MPSLIRLIIVLIFLVGIGYGAMFALVAFVEPRQKEVTVRIPARELFGEETPRLPLGGDTEHTTTDQPATEAPATEPADDQPE